MAEHADFTARDAAAAVAEASSWEGALRRRTIGITWMIWGLVGPAIFLSYALVGVLFGDDFPAWGALLFAPWVAAGVLTTGAVWRSAALTAPVVAEGARPGWVVGAAWFAFLVVAWTGLLVLGPYVNEPTFWLLAIGTAWVLFGVTNLYSKTGDGRQTSVAIGVVLLAVGLALAFLLADPKSEMAYGVATLVATASSAAVPLAVGGWQVLRS